MKRYLLYPLVTIISLVVRQYYLPNPFDCFGEQAAFLNIIAEPIIIALAYVLVGCVYKKASNPALGSILFLITYAILVGVLRLFGIFHFAWWWIALVVIAFIAIVIGVRWLNDRVSDDKYFD